MSRLYDAQWEMPSHTRENVFYTVSRRVDGKWECDCKSWIFQRKKYGPDFECKITKLSCFS